MKKIGFYMALALIFTINSCGGSSGSNPPTPAQEEIFVESMEDLGAIFADLVIPCFEDKQTKCDCPEGGDVSLTEDGDVITMTFDKCKSETAHIFTGVVYLNTVTSMADVNMPSFGECSSLEANSFDPETCAGTISGDCEGSFNCTLNGGDDEDCKCE